MRASILWMSSAAVVTGLAWGALADDGTRTIDISQYLVGRAPAGVQGPDRAANAELNERAAATTSSRERQSALNGTLYAVVAPTYTGTGGTLSYIRLFNGGSTASNFSVTVVGSPSGTTYGTATISVPRSASPQYSMTAILTQANAGALAGGDTGYSLYIQNIEPTAGYQHVIYNDTNRFFENASVCKTLLNQAVATVSNTAVLTNVHTSRIATHPSRIQIHNFWNAAVTYRLTALDATTGAVVGTPVNVVTAPNASYDMAFTELEAQMGWQPTAAQFHANLFVTDPSGAPPYQLLGQSIFNQQLAANINMSTACAVNASTTGGGYSEGPGLNGY